MSSLAAPGTRVTPNLELACRIGAGGMGTVWVAKHLGLHKDVVVKLMNASLVASEELRRRFAHEAAAGANVKSPHVVQVFDTGIADDLGPYIVMELLEGEDLGARLARDGVLPPREVARVVSHVAHALDRAHESGVVHRDIKPANIFLCVEPGAPFTAKVLDFGVVRIRSQAAPQTATGVSLGTPTYMSPEQAAGLSDLDGTSDLYSLGLVAYRALTGAPAFARESFEALGLGVYNLPLPKITERSPALPVALEAWFERACARDPSARFPDGKAMAAELARAIGEASSDPALPSAPPDEAPRTESVTRAHAPAAPEHLPTSTDAGLAQPTAPRTDPSARPVARKRWLPALVGLAILAPVVLEGLALRSAQRASPAPSASAPSAAIATAAPIPIGVLLDLSGERREGGEALLAATRAAETLVNQAGGIRGRPIRLIVKDDQGDTGAFLTETTRALLATEGLKVVLGPMTSAQVRVAAPLVQAAGVLEITGSATSPELTTLQRPEERLLFRTAPSEAVQAAVLARIMRGVTIAEGTTDAPTRCTSVAIIASDDVYGRPFVEVFTRSLKAHGGNVVETQFVPPAAQSTYANEIRAVARSSADCLVLGVAPKVAARYLRQSRYEVPERPGARRPAVFAVDNVTTDDFLVYARDNPRDPSSPSVANGVRGVRPATKLAWRPEYVAFTHLLTASDAGPETAASPYAASQFDAAMLAALTLEAAGPTADATTLRKGFLAIARGGHVYGPQELPQLLAGIRRGETVDYVGASGDLEVDANGDVEADLVTWAVRDGAIVDTGRVRVRVD